jgi:hypothetical protein
MKFKTKMQSIFYNWTHILWIVTFFSIQSINAQSLWKATWNLQFWDPQSIPSVKTSTNFQILPASYIDPIRLALKVQKSASGIVSQQSFTLLSSPSLFFRSRVHQSFPYDPHTKKGDDSPLKVVLLFEYEPELATWTEQVTCALLKQKYGAYPPFWTLSFTWIGNQSLIQPYPSPYTDRVWHIPLGKPQDLGQWRNYSFDLKTLTQQVLGTVPKQKFRIGLFADGDNGGLSSFAEISDLELRINPPTL